MPRDARGAVSGFKRVVSYLFLNHLLKEPEHLYFLGLIAVKGIPGI